MEKTGKQTYRFFYPNDIGAGRSTNENQFKKNKYNVTNTGYPLKSCRLTCIGKIRYKRKVPKCSAF